MNRDIDDKTNDAEGHLAKKITEAKPDDLLTQAGDDTEGHKVRASIDETDDVEGHGAKFK